MKLCSITPVLGGGFTVRVYEVGHAADSIFEDSIASTGTLPPVLRLIGSHHLLGTPRWRHFLRANALTPSSSAALSTNSQSSGLGFSMTQTNRDDLSPRQGTIRSRVNWDSLSYDGGVTDDTDETDAKYLEALLALTRALRKVKGPLWTQDKMATHIGTTLAKYKKYERRTPMPHRLIVRFCETVEVTTEDFLSLKARAKIERAVPLGTLRKQN